MRKSRSGTDAHDAEVVATSALVPVAANAVAAVIFDLDNCLCPATAVGEDLFAPAFAAVRRANRGTLDEASLQRAFTDCWHTAFDAVALRHGFSRRMLEAGSKAFAALEVVGPLVGYADLHVVRELPIKRYLVTSGFRRLQGSKVRALGIEAWFDAVIIDALDDARHPGKQTIFQRLLDAGRWQAQQILVVGDNPASELAAGRRLGMTTVQTLRPSVQRWDEAHHHITSLHELRALIRA